MYEIVRIKLLLAEVKEVKMMASYAVYLKFQLMFTKSHKRKCRG